VNDHEGREPAPEEQPDAPVEPHADERAAAPGASWLPPVTQPPPGYSAGWGDTRWNQSYGVHPPGPSYAAHPAPAPYAGFGQVPPPYGAPATPRHAARASGRVPAWVWPVVCALALALGVFGGAIGGLVVDRFLDSRPGLVSGGLDDVDTVSKPPLPADNGSITAVAEQLLPSTVQIVAEMDGQRGGATGSGFVLDRQGHVITNNHVVADAAEQDGVIEIVDQDGNRYRADVVGRSPVYDLAVLYSRDVRRLRPAALGVSQALRVGEGVVAIGSPLGLSSTVTAGIVSALDRPVTTGDSGNESSYINAVQTDAAINPGNSGGPLVDLQGRVVGVNSAIATTGGFGTRAGNIGVGFAIPIEQVRVTADQILRTGEARYPVIGATVQTSRGTSEGARVEEVMAGTPAEQGGLEEGDVIVAVDGERVIDGIALIVSIRTHQPGEEIEFTVRRDGDEITVDVTLGSEIG
jgi:putative serine protease PepD